MGTHIEAVEARVLFASAGLDSSFGDGGVVDLGTQINFIYRNQSLAEAGNGEVVVASITSTDVRLTKLKADGSLDASFGTGGVSITGLSPTFTIYSLAVDPASGEIAVATDLGDVGSILFFTPTGVLDMHRGKKGAVSLPDLKSGRSLAFGSDGSLVVSGKEFNSGSFATLFVTRLHSDGAVDTHFGDGGITKIDLTLSSQDDGQPQMQLGADGSIYVFADDLSFFTSPDEEGFPDTTTVTSPTLLRFKSNGKLDKGYGNNGRVDLELNEDDDASYGFGLTGNGTAIAVIGDEELTDGIIVQRVLPDGTIDSSLPDSRQILGSDLVGTDEVGSIAVGADGSLYTEGLVGGVFDVPAPISVRKFDARFKPDPSWADNGVARTASIFADDGRPLITPDGRLILQAGIERRNQAEAVVVRFDGGSLAQNASAGSAALDADGTLDITGTSSRDLIRAGARHGQIKVLVNRSSFDFATKDVKRIVIRAGAGSDRVKLDQGLRNTYVQGGGGNDYIQCGAVAANVSGGAGNDRIVGGAAGSFLRGNGGRDTLIGGDGNETLDGGSGNDSIFGGDGNDTIRAGGGHDHLDGGTGDDLLVA